MLTEFSQELDLDLDVAQLDTCLVERKSILAALPTSIPGTYAGVLCSRVERRTKCDAFGTRDASGGTQTTFVFWTRASLSGESPHASMKRSRISKGVNEGDSPSSLSISLLIKKVERYTHVQHFSARYALDDHLLATSTLQTA